MEAMVMKRLASILALGCVVAFVAAQTAETRTFTGYISDSKCRAMHMDNGIGCVKKCIEDGYRPVLVDANKNVWEIENPYAVQDYYSDNVQVVAKVNPSGKSIYIDKITKTGGTLGGMKDGPPM